MSLFVIYLNNAGLAKAMTIALTTMAAFQWFNAWNCRSEKQSIFRLNPFSNKFLILSTVTVIFLQIAAVYTPFLQNILQLVPLSPIDWFIITAVASTTLLTDETWKLIYRRLSLPAGLPSKPKTAPAA
jgi:P-type Ca2+ transporter type 2C